MALVFALLLLLVLVTAAPRESCFGSSLHSLKYIYTSISDPSQELAHFVVLGYMDDQVFAHYDSHNQTFQPRVPWVKKVEKEHPNYWYNYSTLLHKNEKEFKEDLGNLMIGYNHSKGLHTWQRMVSCKLQAGSSKGGLWQYGYNGMTFIAFDKKTLTWESSVPQAQVTRRKWNAFPGLEQYIISYLEGECIAWLKKFLCYRKETLRTEPPEVTVSSKTEVEDGMETHICRVHGFYPREIDASWRRDGEEWLQDTFRGSVAPNADGTFHTWLSIQIDPEERDRYRCHLEHDGLPEPLDVALEEPKSTGISIGYIILYVVAGLVLLGMIGFGIYVFFKRRQNAAQRTRPGQEGFFSLIAGCFRHGDPQGETSRTRNPQEGSEEGSNNSDQGSTEIMLQSSCSTNGHSQHKERGEKMSTSAL
ncbi:major histocompatibility complex class I-related gene protein-like isoform 3-T4 [Vipera latastei]